MAVNQDACSAERREKWFVAAKRADFRAIADTFGIDPVTARIIRNRDVVGEKEIFHYLHGSMEQLHAPELLKGAQEAARLLKQKTDAGKKIRIIGDYDIDGVNATYILYRALVRCGADVDYEIPDRMKDGYGLNLHLIELAVSEGVDTILTCDNGISAMDEIAFAKNAGLTVIVTDHHEPRFEDGEQGRTYLLPDADVLVNPKQPECAYPYKKLCGAAVAWKVVCLFYACSGVPFEEAEELLPFTAFATIGDVMDLDGENRILVKEGLKRMAFTQNFGLRALAEANGLALSDISSYHIGFVLGPCINASGRLDTARRSMKLLLAENMQEAKQLASDLKDLNDERKALTQQAVEEACAMIEGGLYQDDKVLVIYLPGCHESIAGIVAGRLRERYYRPVFVVTDSEEAGGAKGSGRSIEAYSMFEEMVKCGDLFTKYGGHPMAAGFSLERGRIDEMRRRLNENCSLKPEDMLEKVSIDVPMPLDYITERLIGELQLLEPFGKGNEKPLFAERDIRLQSARLLGKNQNVLKFRVMNRSGKAMDALYFGDTEKMRSYLAAKFGEAQVQALFWGRQEGLALDLTYYPSVNEYMGRKSLQIVIKNYL